MLSTSRFHAALATIVAGATSALAGGSAERVLLIINPASTDSMYIGHYYQFARSIPQSNVLYIDPAATDYAAFAGANGNIDALLGSLANKGLTKTIDYVVLAAPDSFHVNAPGLITDGCSPLARLSQTSAFGLAYMRGFILSATLTSQENNRFYGTTPTFFSGSTSYLNGSPNTVVGSRRYLVTSTLGYTGPLGNTLPEITGMIDRSVGADGTHPSGKYYFISTTDSVRNVRSVQFNGAVSALPVGRAEVLFGSVIPDFRNDCLGVLTGWPDPPIDGGNFTLLPGAFCDHLTSWAATFDISAQTKMSSWIRRGASGTCGTVEEPCNYTGKFPHANLHVFYDSGMCLGESWFRSMQYTPFQVLLQGDPITRPHATIPVVSGNVPSGNFATPFVFTPTASTSLPGASIASIELYIDGKLQTAKSPGSSFVINPGALPDGPHEVRVLAYDNTAIRTIGSWTGSFNATSYGRVVTLGMPSTGDLSTAFTASISTSGPGAVREVRLIQNGRVLAASPSAPANLTVYGRNIGPGKTKIQAEVIYTDNIRSLSQPILVNITNSPGSPVTQSPVAFSYRKNVQRGATAVVELPAAFSGTSPSWTLLSNPAQSTVGASAKGYRVITAGANACGQDSLTFRVNDSLGPSNTATVTLVYDSGPACPADFDSSGSLTANDFQSFINAYASLSLKCDINGDCNLNAADFQAFLDAFATGCP